MERLLLIATAVIFAAAFTSCKKDKENICTVKLLKTVTFYSYRYDETYDKNKFEYDEQNRITKISYYFSGGDLYYTSTFTYTEDDLVQVLFSYSSGNVEIFEYTKSDNTITEKYTYNGDGTIPNFTTTSTIELDSDGLPIKQEVERFDGNTFFHIYEYQDGTMTIDRIIYNDDTETRTYTYDNEKGALYYCQTPKWYLILYLKDFGIKNNVIYSGGTTPPRTVYTYKYDNLGLPVERTCKSSGYMQNGEWVEEFTYITR